MAPMSSKGATHCFSWSVIEAIQVLYCYFYSLRNSLEIKYLLLCGWMLPLCLIISWICCRLQPDYKIDLHKGWPYSIESAHCDWFFISIPISISVLIGIM